MLEICPKIDRFPAIDAPKSNLTISKKPGTGQKQTKELMLLDEPQDHQSSKKKAA